MFQLVTLLSMAVLVAADQLIKAAIIATVKVGGPKSFLFGLFRLRYAENTGAAFSIFNDHPEILTAVTSIVVLVILIVILLRKIKPIFPNICLISIISGGLGNVIDRIMRGCVVDFIEPMFIDFAVFNFADCCITVGAFALVIYQIREIVIEYKTKKVKENV